MKGFTLLEMMIVVAIVGVLTAIGASAITGAVQYARVQGAADATTRMLGQARVLAASQHCAYMVQLNGTSYNPPGTPTGEPRGPATISMIRKGNCGRQLPGQPAVSWYYQAAGTAATAGLVPQPADSIVQSQILGEPTAPNNAIAITLTSQTLQGNSTSLTTGAVVFSYGPDGDRHLALNTGAGFAVVAAGDVSSGASGQQFDIAFRHLATDQRLVSTLIQSDGTVGHK